MANSSRIFCAKSFAVCGTARTSSANVRDASNVTKFCSSSSFRQRTSHSCQEIAPCLDFLRHELATNLQRGQVDKPATPSSSSGRNCLLKEKTFTCKRKPFGTFLDSWKSIWTKSVNMANKTALADIRPFQTARTPWPYHMYLFRWLAVGFLAGAKSLAERLRGTSCRPSPDHVTLSHDNVMPAGSPSEVVSPEGGSAQRGMVGVHATTRTLLHKAVPTSSRSAVCNGPEGTIVALTWTFWAEFAFSLCCCISYCTCVFPHPTILLHSLHTVGVNVFLSTRPVSLDKTVMAGVLLAFGFLFWHLRSKSKWSRSVLSIFFFLWKEITEI